MSVLGELEYLVCRYVEATCTYTSPQGTYQVLYIVFKRKGTFITFPMFSMNYIDQNLGSPYRYPL